MAGIRSAADDAVANSADSGFVFFPAPVPALPVLLSVPHAGRHYPAALLARCRVSPEVLLRLEDRYADFLISGLTENGFPAIVATTARAALDLNRDPRDIDGQVISGIPRERPLIQSIKQRGGLGLFPRSLPRAGQLWRRQMPWAEAVALIDRLHAGYHAAIETVMDAVQAQHGAALLLDIHSMPPLALPGCGGRRPEVVIGDRFGSSASTRFSELARMVAADHGYAVALNHPYPGYYLIERHGRPANDRHAIQIEIARDIYLDEGLDQPAAGLRRVRTMLNDLAMALGEEAIRNDFPLAAE